MRKPSKGGGGGLLSGYPVGAVEDIINLPATAYTGVPTPLAGTVIPANAANKTITWTIIDAGATEAILGGDDGDILTATANGTVWIEAVIGNGIRAGKDYKKEFGITVVTRPEYGVRLRINRVEPTNGYTFTSTAAVTVKIENIGNNATGQLAVALGGDNSSSFQVSTETITSIDVDGDADFTVTPADSLSAGTHNATVSVTGSNSISESFDVSYEVPAAPAGTQKTETLSGVSVNFRYVPPSVTSFNLDEHDKNVRITKGYWVMETEVTQELWAAVFPNYNPSYFSGCAACNGGCVECENCDYCPYCADCENCGTDYGYLKCTPADEVQTGRPVDSVNWYAAIAFCNKLSVANDKTPVYTVKNVSDWGSLKFSAIPGYEDYDEDWDAVTFNRDANGYRLPTEVEWVWAAMGASAGGDDVRNKGWAKGYAGSAEGWDEYPSYPNIENIGDYALYTDNSDEVTHEAGKKTANELGLYDMSGNVWEWCWDWEVSWWVSEEEAYEEEALPDDFAGPTEETENIPFEYRILRGGSFFDYDSDLELSNRNYWEPYIDGAPEEAECMVFGFRIVCNE